MDLILEAVIDLAIEGSIEGSKSNKIPKPIRYFLIFIVVLFFMSVIGVITLMGIIIMKDNLIGGIVVLLFALFLLILSFYRFKKIYNIKIK